MSNRVLTIAGLVLAPLFFLLGRIGSNARSESFEADAATVEQTASKTDRARKAASSTRKESDPSLVTRSEREAAVVAVMRLEEARRMTSEERMARFEKAMMICEPSEQAAVVCGLVGALQRDEIRTAVDWLVRTQERGNYFPPTVWKAIWNRWGRLDGDTCFDYLQGGNALTSRAMSMKNGSREVGREVMQGWLATNPEEALAWAAYPKNSVLEAAAAAMALTESANGDLPAMGALLSEFSTNKSLVTEGLVDYYDVAMLESFEASPADIYQTLPAELQPHAVKETFNRMVYDDEESAIDWLALHGTSTRETYQLAKKFADSAYDTGKYEECARVLARLPYHHSQDFSHPITQPLLNWYNQDPVAVKEWLQTQPEDSPWVAGEILQSYFKR